MIEHAGMKIGHDGTDYTVHVTGDPWAADTASTLAEARAIAERLAARRDATLTQDAADDALMR